MSEATQQPMRGNESHGQLQQPISDRQEKIQTERNKKLVHAQRVIQYEYEELGLSPEFLNIWLLNYLIFWQVRKTKTAISFDDAPSYFHLESDNDQDRVNDLWLYMLNPKSHNPESDAKGIHGFKGVKDDGSPVPIYKWINATIKNDQKRWDIKRQNDSYRNPQMPDDLETVGSLMSDDNTLYTSTEVKAWETERWVDLKSEFLSLMMKWRMTDKGQAHLGRAVIAQVIQEMDGEINAAEIARRMRAGNYNMVPDLGREPVAFNVSTKWVEREVAGLRKQLEDLALKQGFRRPTPNRRGFNIKPARTDDEQMSLNGSYRINGADSIRAFTGETDG